LRIRSAAVATVSVGPQRHRIGIHDDFGFHEKPSRVEVEKVKPT